MEDDDWLNSFTEEPEPTPEVVSVGNASTGTGDTPATETTEAAADPFREGMMKIRAAAKGDPNYPKKPVYNKVWMRPKYLQYDYMYKYRTNYYDDVIEYLDKKERGYEMEFPKPQTWPERVLRTFVKRQSTIEGMRKLLQDVKIKQEIKKRSGFYRTSHAKDYYCRKYKIVI